MKKKNDRITKHYQKFTLLSKHVNDTKREREVRHKTPPTHVGCTYLEVCRH